MGPGRHCPPAHGLHRRTDLPAGLPHRPRHVQRDCRGRQVDIQPGQIPIKGTVSQVGFAFFDDMYVVSSRPK